MSFLPAIPLSSIQDASSNGGIAMNANCSLFASVDSWQHCVYIYSVDDAGECVGGTAVVVVGTPGSRGSAMGQLNGPRLACFVNRNGIYTLLVCDFGNDRVVEVSTGGAFIRAISCEAGSHPFGVAYCDTNDVIAVTLWSPTSSQAFMLLQYESGAVKPGTVRSGTAGNADGAMYHPCGVTFTADSRCILVVDSGNQRVCKFSAVNAAFISHVATFETNETYFPAEVLHREDGSLIILMQVYVFGGGARLLILNENGITVHDMIVPNSIGGAFLAYSHSLHAVILKTCDGHVFLLRDAWMHSSRRAWLSAVSMA